MNLVVILASFLLTTRIFKITNVIDFSLSLFITYLSQIIFTELILGILGILNLKNVLLFNFILLSTVWIFTKNKSYHLGLTDAAKTTSGLLRGRIALLFISIISIFALVKLGINLLNPPFGWDSLNYHFVFPVEWLKAGNLDIPITVSDDPSPSYYPINGSLFYLWLIFPFRNVFLADLGQVPFFILAFLSIYSISRKIGLHTNFSFFSAALFLIIPNFFKQLSIAYVDVMVVALFLTCLSYLFLLNEEFSGRYVLLYSMSLGLLLGTKTIALPYSILLLIPFMCLSFKNIRKIHFLFFSFLVIAILGGFSYMRNFFQTGNPLYPLDFRLFGKTIFKGVMDANTYAAHFKIEDYRLSKLLFHEGLGMQTLVFVFPAIFLALPVSIIKRKEIRNFILLYFLILPILIYLAYRFIIPLANTRYLYPLLGTGMILGFYIFELLKINKWINILVIICAFSSMAELAKRQELAVSIIFTILLFFLLPNLLKYLTKREFIRKPLFIIFALTFMVLALIFLEQNYIKNEFHRYKKTAKYSGFWLEATEAWEWLNDNTAGNNIAYIGRPVPFPLYGSQFKNNVYYVSVNKTEPAKLHYFPNSYYRWGYDFSSLHKNLEAENNYRGQANYSIWLTNILKKNTDYLFIYSLHQTKQIDFPLEDKWALSHAQSFKPVFTNETIHIYKINR